MLTTEEKAIREEKLAVLQAAPAEPAEVTEEVAPKEYTPGEKKIMLTERELNGLIHENTSLGEQLKLELVKDAVHARVSADIPEDFPVMAGKKLKGKARFLVNEENGSPTLVLEDVTLWGISLPNAWLGGLKGQNLLGTVLSPDGGSLAGIKEISITDGSLVIELAD